MNNVSTSQYETYSSSFGKGGNTFNISGSLRHSLILCSLHANGNANANLDIHQLLQRSADKTKKDFEFFQSILHRSFINYLSYDKMRPNSSQTIRLYATAKTHKLNDLDDIIVEKLIFRPIVDQTGTATYPATKVIGKYLNLLPCSEYKISDCLKIPDLLKVLPPLQKDEEYVSYYVDSLFRKIPLKETVDCIIHKICNEKLLKLIL